MRKLFSLRTQLKPMSTFTTSFLRWWLQRLNLPKQSPPAWYRDRLREELKERRAATTSLRRLSETADVYFTCSRAEYDGFPLRKLPPCSALASAYMVGKFTSRWMFYRLLALSCRCLEHGSVREVVNPGKDSKLREVAMRHQIDCSRFMTVGRRLRRVWPLLP